MSSGTYLLVLLLSAQATAGTTVERTDTLGVRVTDEEAAAVAGVEVFVRTSRSLTRLGATNARGEVAFPHPGEAILNVEGLGYVPAVVRVGVEDRALRLVLRRAPLPAGELRVFAVDHACARPDDPEARMLWEEAAGSYDQDEEPLHITASVTRWSERVEWRHRGDPPHGEGLASTLAGSGGLAMDPLIEAQGYAVDPWLATPTIRTLDYHFWRYPRFDLFDAQHLVSPVFGQLNTFAVMRLDDDMIDLSFCGRDRDRPYVVGRVTVADNALVSAYWEFVTPEHHEDAGGHAVFAPVLDDTERLVIPLRSAYWRRTSSGTFFQRYLEVDGWTVRTLPGGAFP